MKLWITRTNEAGVPLTYDGVLLQGPTVWTWRDLGEGRYVRAKFNLDPPFALPGPGLYAFFVQDPCELSFSLLADTSRNVYPAGHYWDTPRVVIGPCILPVY